MTQKVSRKELFSAVIVFNNGRVSSSPSLPAVPGDSIVPSTGRKLAEDSNSEMYDKCLCRPP